MVHNQKHLGQHESQRWTRIDYIELLADCINPPILEPLSEQNILADGSSGGFWAPEVELMRKSLLTMNLKEWQFNSMLSSGPHSHDFGF
jgi:hypothetical protein